MPRSGTSPTPSHGVKKGFRQPTPGHGTIKCDICATSAEGGINAAVNYNGQNLCMYHLRKIRGW